MIGDEDVVMGRVTRGLSFVRPRGRGRRLLLAVALTAFLAAGLGAVGGLSYAASIATQVAGSAKRHAVYLGSEMPVTQQVRQVASAATDQYGGGGSGGSGGSSGGSSGGTTGGTSGGTSSTTSSTTTATSSSSGEVTVTSQTAGSAPVSVGWQPGTFATTVAVTVDAAVAPIGTIVGQTSAIVSIVATDPSTGQPVHQLGAPMTIVFAPPAGGFPRGYIPLISTDGATWAATSQLSSATLPADREDGFYVWKAADGAAHPVGTIVILTRHLTLFAVLSSANASVSESGRKTPQAGSGLFGDPTRNHLGAPRMSRIGARRPRAEDVRFRLYVPLTFLLDEQAVLHVAIFDAHGKRLGILRDGTVVRGHPITGSATKDLKLLVLRPGTIKLLVRLQRRQILPGYRYRARLWAVDYDGHRTVRYITFTG